MATLKIVSTGGVITIGANSVSPTSLYDGTLAESTSLRRRVNTISAQPMEYDNPEESVTSTQYELSATVYVGTDDTTGFFAVTDGEVYATYKSATSSTAFAGTCIPVDTGDDQRSQQFATQTITLRSSGAPDVG